MAKKDEKKDTKKGAKKSNVPTVGEVAAMIVQATSGDPKATVQQLGTKTLFLEASIAEDGRGGTIGKKGRTINATLTILRAVGGKNGIHVRELRILDTEKKTETKKTKEKK